MTLIFDIGANIGKWSLANINTADRIIAIEASPTTYTKLVNHTNSNKITCENFAVTNNNNQPVVFFEAYSADVLSTTNKDWLTNESSRFFGIPFKEIVCPTITIDRLIEKYGIPDLIKIDVESGEFECISSLSQKVKLLCFEWAAEVNDITFKCIDYLQSLGFTQFYIQYADNYTFRPSEFHDSNTVKEQLSKSIPKVDWGMIWCQ
jgi:FkbM family methyltransferase